MINIIFHNEVMHIYIQERTLKKGKLENKETISMIINRE
jgi:hypothetical protein